MISNSIQKGFTVIEVLVASMILFISIALVASIFQTNSRLTESGRNTVKRAFDQFFIAQQVKETLRVLPFQTDGQGIWSGYEYQWQIIDTKRSNTRQGIDEDTGLYSTTGRELFLRIILVQTDSHAFEFNYLTWQ